MSLSDADPGARPAATASVLPPPRPLKSLRRRARRVIAGWPWVYVPLRRARLPDRTVGRDTELVVEGFPRTGNTFTEFVLRASQDRPLRLAHHSHAPAQVAWAVDRGIPVLVILREPRATLVSLVTAMHDVFTPASALDEYNWYHRALLPFAGRIAALTLSDVTARLPETLAALNDRFGLSLAAPARPWPQIEAEALRLMNERSTDTGVDIGGMSPCNPQRAKADEAATRAAIAEMLASPALAPAMAEATALVDELSGRAHLFGSRR